jgi:hypothetical protein
MTIAAINTGLHPRDADAVAAGTGAAAGFPSTAPHFSHLSAVGLLLAPQLGQIRGGAGLPLNEPSTPPNSRADPSARAPPHCLHTSAVEAFRVPQYAQ